MILLHPNHPYSSNPIPPKLNLHLSPSSEFSQFTGSKRKPREYRHRMKIFNILLASKAVFGAEKCHLPVSICIQKFLFCISNFATFGPSIFELWDRPVKKIWDHLLQGRSTFWNCKLTSRTEHFESLGRPSLCLKHFPIITIGTVHFCGQSILCL